MTPGRAWRQPAAEAPDNAPISGAGNRFRVRLLDDAVATMQLVDDCHRAAGFAPPPRQQADPAGHHRSERKPGAA